MGSNNKDIRAVIGLVNNGQSFPAISLTKSNPEMAATISKLVTSRQQTIFSQDGNRASANIDKNNFSELSKDIIEKTGDSESIMQLFPDMELAAQILTSSIISPKDMTGSEIIYTSPNTILSSEVAASMISTVKKYYEKDYNMKSLLPKMLREILFESGSFVKAVIPESSIDELINGTSKIGIESIAEYVNKDGDVVNLGILGDPRSPKDKISSTFISIETFKEYNSAQTYNGYLTHLPLSKSALEDFKDSRIKIIDNYQVLKLPQVFQRLKKQRVSNILNNNTSGHSMSFENKTSKLSDSQMQSLLYKNKERGINSLIRVKTKEQAQRNTIGKPLILKLPSESVIPVHVPGNEQEHIGYFVLIDSEGNPLNRASNQNHFTDLQSKISNQNNSMSSYLMQRSKNSFNAGGNPLSVDQATRIYSDIIESDLLERLRTGAYGSNVTIAKNEEIYRVMLARTLANQSTQLLYLPGELVTYFAYKYDKNGIGKSLHDDLRILNSLRAMMMFSRVMASLKNSIGRTNVRLKLDERDIDPQKSIETAIHEISKTRQQYFPLGMNSPVDLVDWIQKSGFEFTFEGHPKIPDMQIEFQEKNSNYVKPDTDLDDELRKRAIMGMGLSPETVDNGFSSEFATTVVANNLLLAKRVIQIQDHISPLMTDHAKKITMNDGNLLKDLKNVLEENFDKLQNVTEGFNKEDTEKLGGDKNSIINYLLNDFIDNITLSLPQPNSVTLENQMASFTIYSEALDKALDAWISTEIINSNMSGEISNNVDSVKAIIKAHYLRKWMADNNVLTELSELTTNDDAGNPMLNFVDIQENHINGLVRSIVHLYKDTKIVGAAADKDLEKITNGDGVDDTNNSSTPLDTTNDNSNLSLDDNPLPPDDDGSDNGMPPDLPPLGDEE